MSINNTNLEEFEYLVILDFEATCERGVEINNQEIIEFPMIILDLATNEVTSHFQKQVRPTLNPALTAFCTQLTGITQQTVDDAQLYPHVYQQAVEFLQCLQGRSWVFVTCGNWDLDRMLPKQMGQQKELEQHHQFRKFVNLKDVFVKNNFKPRKKKQWDLNEMLEQFGLTFEGRKHSGIVDCQNIVRVCQQLRSRDILFRRFIKHAHY